MEIAIKSVDLKKRGSHAHPLDHLQKQHDHGPKPKTPRHNLSVNPELNEIGLILHQDPVPLTPWFYKEFDQKRRFHYQNGGQVHPIRAQSKVSI